MNRVQRVRHSADQAATFVGLQGEFTYDIDGKSLRLHDGATPGGAVVSNDQQNKQSYMARSSALEQLAAATGVGLYVKTATSAVLRSLVAGTHITITEPAGQADDITIEVSGLGTAAEATLGTGDAEIPNSAQVKVLAQAVADVVLPLGLISLWSGTIASIPTGWHLCDGTNGTVDLRDKFVVGAKQDNAGVPKTNVTGALTSTGGAASVSTSAAGAVAAFTTGGTALTIGQLPSHSFFIAASEFSNNASAGYPSFGWGRVNGDYAYQLNGSNLTPTLGKTNTLGSGELHAHTVSAIPNHQHTAATLPPYFALAFIQRIA